MMCDKDDDDDDEVVDDEVTVAVAPFSQTVTVTSIGW